MKLKTKLIPLTSISLLGATFLPLGLSSCGSKTAMNHAYDLTQNYYPTIERFESGSKKWTANELNNEYAAQLERNLDTFVQDYYWSKSWTGISFEQLLFWQKLVQDEVDSTNKRADLNIDRIVAGNARGLYTKDTEIISNLSSRIESVEWNEEMWNIPILSFTLKFNSNVRNILFQNYLYHDVPVSGSIGGNVSGEIQFYDVPFYIRSRIIFSETSLITQQVISFEPFYEWMAGELAPEYPVPHWQIKTNVKSIITGEMSYTTGVIQRLADDWLINVTSDEQNPSWQYEELSLEETIGCVFTNSYYFEKTQIERE